MALKPRWRKCLIVLGILVVLGAWLGIVGWYKFFREEPQVGLDTPELQFKYGSLGSESERGIPYYVWLVLPRIFPDKMPGPGGYRSFGFAWEPGRETPVGFAKKTVGFPRVTNNCAMCHTATYRRGPDDDVHVVIGGPSHRADVVGYINFLIDA